MAKDFSFILVVSFHFQNSHTFLYPACTLCGEHATDEQIAAATKALEQQPVADDNASVYSVRCRASPQAMETFGNLILFMLLRLNVNCRPPAVLIERG